MEIEAAHPPPPTKKLFRKKILILLKCHFNVYRISGFNGVRVTRSLVLCACFVDRCLYFCTFSFDHCVVCCTSVKFPYIYPRVNFKNRPTPVNRFNNVQQQQNQ